MRLLHSPYSKLGWIFLSVYAFFVAAIFLFVFTARGDMAGIFIIFAALPWPLVGNFLFEHTGMVVGMWGGLVLNAAGAFLMGYFISYLNNRSANAGPNNS